MLNKLIKHEDKNFDALVEKSKQENKPLNSIILYLIAQFYKLLIREMQDTASKLEALELKDSNSIEKRDLQVYYYHITMEKIKKIYKK